MPDRDVMTIHDVMTQLLLTHTWHAMTIMADDNEPAQMLIGTPRHLPELNTILDGVPGMVADGRLTDAGNRIAEAQTTALEHSSSIVTLTDEPASVMAEVLAEWTTSTNIDIAVGDVANRTVESPSGWSYRVEQENGDRVDCWACGHPIDDDAEIENDDHQFAYHKGCKP